MSIRSSSAGRLDALERDAPDLVGPFRALGDGQFIALRREVRRLAAAGSAVRSGRELRPVGAAPS